MAEYGIPTSQYEQYASSVHGVALLEGRDLGAPACNDCHGNHGAMPPGVESISKVCGSCHVLNSELFSGSPHKKAFDERHLPECETCHGNHAIAAATRRLLGSDTDAVCSRCHTGTENVAGYLAAGVMRKLVDSLEAGEHGAIALVDDAEQKGMEITEARFRLRDARQARLETRTIVHSFNVDRFRETAEKGLTASSMVAVEAKAAIDEYYRRRIGLGVATLLMTVLAISLYVFIKRLERSGAPRADG
jgi:predicted CXXCH cytochrome family protein